MSTPLSVTCRKSGCDAEIGGYDQMCPTYHLQYQVGKVALVVLLASVMVAIHLFHISGSLWPMYELAATGIVFAFAIAFSRGRALGAAAFAIMVIVACWGTWELTNTLADSRRASRWSIVKNLESVQDWFLRNPTTVVLTILIVSTLWVYLVVNATALDGIHQTARLYLAIGTFVLGTWGAWGVLIQRGIEPEWLMEATLIVTVLSPLVIIFGQTGVANPTITSLGSKWLAVSFWISLFAGYLAVARSLVNMVSYFLQDVLPRLVGRPLFDRFDEFLVVKYADWASQLSFYLQLFALVSLMAATLTKTVDSFQAVRPTWLVDRREKSRARPTSALVMIIQLPAEYAMVVAGLALNLSLLIVEFMKNLIKNVVQMVLQLPEFLIQALRYLVLPVGTFAATSLALLIALQHLRTYVAQDLPNKVPSMLGSTTAELFDVQRSVRSLWGEAITVVVLAIVIGSITFVIARPEFRNEGLGAIGVIVLGYVAVSLLSSVFLLLSSDWYNIELPFHFEAYGSLLKTNLFLLGLFILFMVVAVIPVGIRSNSSSAEGTMNSNATMVIGMVLLVVGSGYVLFLGVGPLFNTAWDVLRR